MDRDCRRRAAGSPESPISWVASMSFSPSHVLSKAELARVSEHQAAEQRRWQDVGPEGYLVECLDREFLVLSGVFPPRDDSRLLVESLEIKPGEDVLDIGTGSGVLAVFAALEGAAKVLAVDWNEDAVENTKRNVERHEVSSRVEARVSNIFSMVGEAELFDVILANLPARNKAAPDVVAAAQWDTAFQAHKTFFGAAHEHLQSGGRIYMVMANYPEVAEMVKLAEQAGFEITVAGEKTMSNGDPRTYYAFVLTLK
jgi:release factor glutamine methyltransferase